MSKIKEYVDIAAWKEERERDQNTSLFYTHGFKLSYFGHLVHSSRAVGQHGEGEMYIVTTANQKVVFQKFN